ncbi:MAG TPA: DUF3307 domain-containing protein [Candidatus Omnitrophota bacterium]|nr:DUF3307 domain-containing protein [Candidatus Omnitrophota bacterium]
MFLFLKLILAHLVADFVLQFEELYRLKVKSLLGHIAHVLIHGIVTLLCLFPYLNELTIWLFVAGLMATHLIQDFIKYTLTKKIPKNTFVYFMIDQCFHLLVLSAIFLLPVSSDVRGFPNHLILNTLYTQSIWTVNAIFFLLLTFASSYTLFAFYQSYRKDARPDHGITSLEIIYTSLERILIGGIALFTPNLLWLLITPLIGLVRLPIVKMRDQKDFMFSLTFSIILGLFFRLFQ